MRVKLSITAEKIGQKIHVQAQHPAHGFLVCHPLKLDAEDKIGASCRFAGHQPRDVTAWHSLFMGVCHSPAMICMAVRAFIAAVCCIVGLSGAGAGACTLIAFRLAAYRAWR